MSTIASSLVDVLVIGGGPAGLAVATGLARQLHTAIVFDSGAYRNALVTHMHNVPTWDHQDPAAFRKKARADIEKRYSTIQFQSANLTRVFKTPQGGFEVEDDQGTAWKGRKLVLATGVEDLYPNIEGYGDCWARGIFQCLFCHGYEERGAASAGVLAIDSVANAQTALHLARMAKRLVGKVTIYTNGADALADQVASAAVSNEVSIERSPITRLEKAAHEAEVVVHLKGGKTITEGFLAHKPKTRINGPFADQLSLELTEQGDIKVTPPFNETSVPSVFAAGDCAGYVKAVTQGVAMGTMAAAGAAIQLQIPVSEESSATA